MASTDLIEAGTAGTTQRQRQRNPLVDHPPSSELAFPGCKPVYLPREKLELHDGRLEFWDGATEFAASSVDAVFEAASVCKDETEFLAALRPPRIPDGAGGAKG